VKVNVCKKIKIKFYINNIILVLLAECRSIRVDLQEIFVSHGLCLGQLDGQIDKVGTRVPYFYVIFWKFFYHVLSKV